MSYQEHKHTLLRIPAEIRLEILRYALCDFERNYLTPNIILVRWPPAFCKSMVKSMKAFYGTAEMSNLFVICRQLHDELEELLYAHFVFDFRAGLNLDSARGFLNTINERSRNLLRVITVPISLGLGMVDHPNVFPSAEREIMAKDNGTKVQQTREAFTYLRDTLPGLKRVRIDLDFSWGPTAGSLEKQKMNEFIDTITGLVGVFAASLEVVLLPSSDSQKCRKHIFKVCEQRMGELKLGSGAQQKSIA